MSVFLCMHKIEQSKILDVSFVHAQNIEIF
ncbi:Uncharacterised protein [Yersinia enterocolitica]|uniref:Uncharacterized protein n=1 Tax=Yersinia enterocolitica TaxID=630 RepID=A0ABP1YIC1_YEREN|nr:Uncharacterised protein [Yersinia enterocolitica]CNE63221.1 Uncharacterised protein [Yersinia enterocolitica]CNG29422.1 Uncharacterised protein [Yersinia enterocolitica]CRX88598.1 Uncharacterised protein [Yersinia enterocolitica]